MRPGRTKCCTCRAKSPTGPATRCRSSSNVQCLPSFLNLLQSPHFWFAFVKMQNPMRRPCKMTLERPNMLRTCGVFRILICFAPQSRALFEQQTSFIERACFRPFDFDLCLARKPHAIFDKTNFQKHYNAEAFSAFRVGGLHLAPQPYVLFQQHNCQNCSGAEVLLDILTWRRAWRRNRVQLFSNTISKSAPNLRCFERFWL